MAHEPAYNQMHFRSSSASLNNRRDLAWTGQYDANNDPILVR